MKWLRKLLVPACLLVAPLFATAASTNLIAPAAVNVQAITVYSDSQCSGTPVRVIMTEGTNCSSFKCGAVDYNGRVVYRTTACFDSDRHKYVADVFNGVSFVTLDYFLEDECTDLKFSSTYLAAGTCQSGANNSSVITQLYTNGSASIHIYDDPSCGVKSSEFFVEEESITNHTCVDGVYKFYSSSSEISAGTSSGSTTESSSESNGSTSTSEVDTSSVEISTTAIVGIVVGCVVLVLVLVFIVAYVVVWRRAKRKSAEDELTTPTDWTPGKNSHQTLASTTAHGHSTTSPSRPSDICGTMTGMWDDEAIVAARVPREKVIVTESICRGGYGEVFTGTFNGELVAVKMLLPETRKAIRHVNEFLGEIKIMASMEHPRITRFIGVAWDSLSDLCVVSEYMVGGDLRALLNNYDKENRPKGFDRTKVQIALHIAHALTYLHSLDPAVIHRDLKSKNVLLTAELDAKLTDFGISRERVDHTMTAGVGTSLWMAPEVMIGERYDDKADMFSFGVVLSELDSHALPYSHAKDSNNSGRKMPDAVILQQVTMGRLTVQFSKSSCQSMEELGIACIAVDPNDRPTSAEALGKLHHILTHEMQS